ncbi:hypothetical protein BN1723_007202 [Verticillium longisporum]|uniref:Ubiquitin carboxyl-terminal hydrolase n=1 Tax=Verticillium longisporum TaxID=100787 RepID=A0A0G4NJU5_VERLO|nr:hypothetical protein BN1723_007202 [Verticillium longisporum]
MGRTDVADPHDDSAIDVSEGPITAKSQAAVADEPDELITVTPLPTPAVTKSAVTSVVKSKGKRKRALLPDTDYDATDELAIMDDTKGPERNPKRKATEAVVTQNRSSEDTLKEALAPVTMEDIHQWTGWCELESEPAFFNAILRDCGVKDVKIQELFSLDEDSLQLLPQPVYGLIFLYQYFAQDCEVDDEQGQDHGIWFANQTTDNACATVAMMNIVMNSDVELGPELQSFRDSTKDMCFALRGHALSQNAHIRTIHNSLTLVPLPRRGDGKGPLQDGNQLSLREQENVIDRIEKENFGLKLKIHFLEEALRKAGPGFSEAALKENTELKVDKVTMQRDLQKYKKHLTTAEKDLESYRQQMLQLQEKAKKKYADEKQLAEIDRLQQSLEEKESDLEYLQRQVQQEKGDSAEVEKLRDEIGDLEADLREKDRLIGEHEDQVDDLQAKLNEKDEVLGEREDEIEDYKARLKRAETNAAGEHDEQLRDLETKLQETEAQFKHAQRRMIEMEQEAETQSRQALRRITELEQKAEDEAKQAQRRILELEQKAEAGSSANDELEDARDTIQDLEASIRRLEAQVDEIQDKADDAISDKKRAESDLQELQDEMANKSVVTKGFSRQKEERLTRLQKELEQADERYATLEKEFSQAMTENRSLKSSIQETRQSKDLSEQEHHSLVAKVEELRKELQARIDEKSLLQTRHDALTSESASLQRDVSRLQRSVDELEENLSQERCSLALRTCGTPVIQRDSSPQTQNRA